VAKINHKNLYLLRLKDDEKFSRMYDIATWFIVRATSVRQARQFAADSCSDEGENSWLDKDKSTCTVLTPESAGLGIIMRDFRAG